METTGSAQAGAGRHGPASPRPDSAQVLDGASASATKSKIEQQIVLRLPERLAAEIRKQIADQSLTNASISIHPTDDRNVIFRVEGMGDYHGTLVDLPCIIESLKTWDGAAYYKSADICQMLIVRENGDHEVPPVEYPSGLAPPTAHIRERRFRKHQFSREEIQQAESHLWNILQGQPQVHYELIEEEVELDEDAADEEEEEYESGDEWEEEDEDESKWRMSSMTGDSASILRATPLSEQRGTPVSTSRFTPGHEMASPGRFAVPSTGPHIRQSTPSMLPASATSSINRGPTPDVSPFGRPFSTPGFAPRPASIPPVPDASARQFAPPAAPTPVPSERPFAQPSLPESPVPAPQSTPMSVVTDASSPIAPEGVPTGPMPSAPSDDQAAMAIDEPDLDSERAALRQKLESEIAELQARIEDLAAKSQTTNKILKKRFTKNLEEAQQALQQKQAGLSALS